jgi:phosphodiesterase/alkaline phosphatase D-like protein
MKLFTLAAFLLLCVCVGTAQTPATPTTPAQTAPATATADIDITHGPVLEYVSDHDAVIAWTSKAGSDMGLHYGNSPSSLVQVASQAADAVENSRGTNHRAKITNLQPGTLYYFDMTTRTGQQIGQVYQFTTPAKGAAPIRQQNLGK